MPAPAGRSSGKTGSGGKTGPGGKTSSGGKSGPGGPARSGGKPRTGGTPRSAKPASQRQLRVAEEIRHVLAGIFARGEVRDPDLADVLITVTEVRIGPDLKRATAFVTRLGRSDIGQKLPALRRAAPFLRHEMARELRLRVAPDLSFQADETIDYAMHINDVLHSAEVQRDLQRPTES